MISYEERIAALREMIGVSRAIVVLGGAGLSTESGIPDFRSEDSISRTIDCYGEPPEEILSERFFFANPDVFFDYYKKNLLVSAEPNAAHHALARLERTGRLLSIITQNVDQLHQAAGSLRVLQLHGTTAENRCTDCGRFFPASFLLEQPGVPRCPDCGAIIKPEVTLYDEYLNEYVLKAAKARMFSADMLIIAGTSLCVYPAADLPQYFMGRRLVVINRTETSMDTQANLLFRESAGRVLTDAIPVTAA